MIELKNISFSYNGREIFHDLNLQVEKGSFALLVGETGAGKTTLAQLLIGEIVPDRGEIVVSGERIDALSKTQLAKYRRSVGFVFDEIMLLEERTVEENVALPLEIEGKLSKQAIRKQVARQLETVHLAGKAKSLPRELSLGERQRTAIARALVTEPLLLVADCPTSQLDEPSAQEIVAILAEQNIRGMTVLVTMTGLANRELFPRNTQYIYLRDGIVQNFLPETPE